MVARRLWPEDPVRGCGQEILSVGVVARRSCPWLWWLEDLVCLWCQGFLSVGPVARRSCVLRFWWPGDRVRGRVARRFCPFVEVVVRRSLKIVSVAVVARRSYP